MTELEELRQLRDRAGELMCLHCWTTHHTTAEHGTTADTGKTVKEQRACPRCAELEARLANFEKETFTELRAKVEKLEAIRQLANEVCVAMHPPKVQTAIHKLHGVLWELTKSERGKLPEPFKTSGYVYLPESADPHANPTEGTFMWVDEEGKAWIRTSEGNVYPHPLFNQSDDEK